MKQLQALYRDDIVSHQTYNHLVCLGELLELDLSLFPAIGILVLQYAETGTQDMVQCYNTGMSYLADLVQSELDLFPHQDADAAPRK